MAMRALFALVLVHAVIATQTYVQHADVEVDSRCGGARQCGTCNKNWDGITNEIALEAGHYVATPTEGAWSAWSSGDTGRWLWFTKFKQMCDGTEHTLGDGTRYNSPAAALAAAQSHSITLDLTQDCVVKFGVLDNPCSDNRNMYPGDVSMHFMLDKFCGHAPSADPANGAYDQAGCVNKNAGETCTPVCNAGYTASGPATCVAGAAQVWATPLPTCEPSGCTGVPPYTPTDGTGWTCTAPTYTHGASCAPVCTTGNVPEANALCEFGVWTTSGNCHRNNADDCLTKPTDPTNGWFDDCKDVWNGATCKLTCQAGYTKTGDAVCGAGSAYNTPLPTCQAASCTAPPAQPANSVTFATDCSNTGHGAACPVQCFSGYTLSAPIMCNAGQWTASYCDDVCSSVTCPSDPSDCQVYQCNRLNGGSCDLVIMDGLPCGGWGTCDATGTCIGTNTYCKCADPQATASCGLGTCTLKSSSRSVTSFSDPAFDPESEFGAGLYSNNGTHLWTNDQRWMCTL